MKVLVTGASGLLGQMICSELVSSGVSVVGLDIQGSKINNSYYSHIEGNQKNKLLLERALDGCEHIVHSAICVGVNYNEKPEVVFENNVFGTFQVYEAVKSSKLLKNVVLLSSAPVDKEALDESDGSKWLSHKGDDHTYDLTKRLQEEIARDYFETFGIKTVTLRIGHIVDGANITTLSGTPLQDFNYCRGGWVDLGDVAKACKLALAQKKNRLYNIIGSHQARLRFPIEESENSLGWKPQYQFMDA